MRRLYLALMLLFALSPAAVRAQGTDSVRVTPENMVAQLTLRDGSVLIGRVIGFDATSVRFVSSLGETNIPRSSISAIRLTGKELLRNGEYWPEDPSRTRLLFAPTGRMMHEGEAYLTDAYVFFPSVQFGVSDLFSVGVGASLLPGIAIDDNILYVTPKVALYRSPKFNVAAGALLAFGKVVSDAAPVGLGYGVATIGDENNSLTLGGGFGFANGESTSLGVAMIGGSARVSKSVALLTENYVATTNSSSSIFSGGVRFIGDRLTADFAIWGGPNVETLVPYVAFIYRF